MKRFEIWEESNGRFATVSARTAAAALNKAARQFPRRAVDYEGYRGPVVWRAFEVDGEERASKTFYVR